MIFCEAAVDFLKIKNSRYYFLSFIEQIRAGRFSVRFRFRFESTFRVSIRFRFDSQFDSDSSLYTVRVESKIVSKTRSEIRKYNFTYPKMIHKYLRFSSKYFNSVKKYCIIHLLGVVGSNLKELFLLGVL